MRALVFSGQPDGAHKPYETTPVIRAILQQDSRFTVEVSEDIEELSRLSLNNFDVIILNYCNWKQPQGLSKGSKKAFTDYLRDGGGLTIIHFANGAWHHALPEAGASDWPEYRKICRRVWDFSAGSAHDKYGKFTARITQASHPITTGMEDFETEDELYFNQQGDEPIEPLVVGRSKKTGRDEPLAFAYSYGKGRVFQTLLGHNAHSLSHPGEAQLLRRGTVWAAGRTQLTLGPRGIDLKAVLESNAESGSGSSDR